MKALDVGIKTALSANTGTGGVSNASTGATGGIFQLMAPQGTIPPYVVFQELTDLASYTFSSLAYDHILYQVKAFAVDDPNGAFSGPAKSGDLADSIRTLLTNPTGLNVSGKAVLYCRFIRSVPPMREWDEANGRYIYSKGCIFELWLS